MESILKDDVPPNVGQLWSDEEEALLLEELNNNESVETIAQNHGRTIGGINSRRREIACKLHAQNVPIGEIIRRTRLRFCTIEQAIAKKQNDLVRKSKQKEDDNLCIELTKNNFTQIQNDINQIKCILRELVETMKNK